LKGGIDMKLLGALEGGHHKWVDIMRGVELEIPCDAIHTAGVLHSPSTSYIGLATVTNVAIVPHACCTKKTTVARLD
jgi:hypothetical protein